MDQQRILVVEDNEPLLEVIKSLLEEEGYAVQTATDGIKALQVMEQVRPDLIIADIMMPHMDGYAFYEAVHERPDWIPIPFIFLTALSEREDRLRGKNLGAEDYLTKPFDSEELLVAVRSRLRRAGAIQEVMEAEFDSLKQRIVTMLGHELRTPLAVVMGYSEVALDSVLSLSPEEIQEFLLRIQRGTQRLHRLVSDLLLMVQLDMGVAANEYRQLVKLSSNVGEVIEDVVKRYNEWATQKGLMLECSVEPDLPPVRLCEPFFVNALERLMDNGIKFTHEKGKKVQVSARTAGDWLEISVMDEGVGIPAEEAPHLFRRFHQVYREQMEQQGAGVGLAIARDLIRLHGGDIRVSSVPGKGSTFTIRLPAGLTEYNMDI